MDTSETYIKMRLAAIPDLGMGEPPQVDWDKPRWSNDKVFVDTKGDFYYADEEKACQLERQDQLQEMMREASEVILLESFFCFVFNPNKNFWQTEYTRQFTSMEQLWLAFVMSQLYNKVWNREQWIAS